MVEARVDVDTGLDSVVRIALSRDSSDNDGQELTASP